MKKVLKNLRNLKDLFSDCGMTGLDFVSMNIGYDGKVYFLAGRQESFHLVK